MVTLLILDGYGYSEDKVGNAIIGNSRFVDRYKRNYPNCLLEASGEDVGLIVGQMGNSETGHINIGAGRVVYQDLAQINDMIKSGEMKKNKAILEAVSHAKQFKSNVHIMGLLSDGGVHSEISHAEEIIKILNSNGIRDIYFHAFLDGRDTPIDSGLKYFLRMQKFLDEEIRGGKRGSLISVAGRIYAMDRERRFERVQRVYNMLTGISVEGYEEVKDLRRAIENNYKKELYDEFMPPMELKDTPDIENDDVIIFFNFRTDRMRELTAALSQKNFKEFDRKKLENNFIVTMAEYDKSFKDINIILEPEKIKNCLSEVLAKHEKRQFRVAETTKYAHITFFFNGGVEKPFNGEDRMLIDSINIQDFSRVPKMRAKEITEEAIKAIKSKKYDFVLINLSNPDMIGHTGNLKATKKAIKFIDKCTNKIVSATLRVNGEAIITADHGNAEKVEDENGNKITTHTTNPVPLILVSEKYKNVKLHNSNLASISPTVLKLMNIPKPKEMSGEELYTD
ncbi:MAG: 2,3-bisphosphoglycerate-independent phosphoglycerate mutase [Clostridia bacterium]|nr:2,3-bisphosphoglycerate-independent phosphoglycerate mutase [Clostridia bacterium]